MLINYALSLDIFHGLFLCCNFHSATTQRYLTRVVAGRMWLSMVTGLHMTNHHEHWSSNETRAVL